MIFQVKGMTCHSCARHVTAAVRRLDANASVAVDVAGGTVRIDDTAADADALRTAIANAGYTAVLVS